MECVSYEENIRMCFKEIVVTGVNSIHLPQDRVQCWASVNVILDFRFSQ